MIYYQLKDKYLNQYNLTKNNFLKMKKILFVMACVFALCMTACSTGVADTTDTIPTDTTVVEETVEVVDTVVDTTVAE